MSSVALLGLFALGFSLGVVGGIILGIAWYERKCRLLSDHSSTVLGLLGTSSMIFIEQQESYRNFNGRSLHTVSNHPEVL
ncbi:MAG: hypothetical protein ACLP0B_09930 [Steroidobacteraceae bacterium]